MFDIKVIKEPINLAEIKRMASEGFGDMVKAVVDVEKGTMAIGGELHADIEVVLMEEAGALRNNTWGINLYPNKIGKEFIEFDSMVNLKPALGNRTRNVENPAIQEKIKKIVNNFILNERADS